MKQLNQKGFSAVEGLIILIVLAAVGFAAFAVISRQKETVQTPTVSSKTATTDTKNTEVKTEYKEGSIDSGFGVTLDFSYPSVWKMTSSIEGPMPLNSSAGSTTQTIELSSPSGEYKVTYKIGANGGLGGACSPLEGGKIAYLNTKPLQGFNNATYVETFFENVAADVQNGVVTRTTTMPVISVMQTNKVSATAVQKSACDIYLADVIKLSEPNGVTLLGAKMEISNVSDETMLETFKSKLSGAEYEQAKAILLSTSVK